MIQPVVRRADCDNGGGVPPVLVRKYSLDLLVSKARRRDRVEGDMSPGDAVAVSRPALVSSLNQVRHRLSLRLADQLLRGVEDPPGGRTNSQFACRDGLSGRSRQAKTEADGRRRAGLFLFAYSLLSTNCSLACPVVDPEQAKRVEGSLSKGARSKGVRLGSKGAARLAHGYPRNPHRRPSADVLTSSPSGRGT